jgi:hypothetical protein
MTTDDIIEAATPPQYAVDEGIQQGPISFWPCFGLIEGRLHRTIQCLIASLKTIQDFKGSSPDIRPGAGCRMLEIGLRMSGH